MSLSEIKELMEITSEKIGVLALPFTVPAQHDASPVHCAGPSLSR
jgi:hypothetical protein